MKKIKSTAIFANGYLINTSMRLIKNYDCLIATDSAALLLLKKKIIPDFVIGDFDSVSKDEFTVLKNNVPKLLIYPACKDKTDLELCLEKAVNLNPQKIDVYGATGTRIDHTLAAVFLLEKYIGTEIEIRIIDKNNILMLIEKDINLIKNRDLKYLSLFSLTAISQISLSGFRFNLKNETILRSSSRCVSNEIKRESARISIKKGKLIMIRSTD